MEKTTVLQNGIVYSEDKMYSGGFVSFQGDMIQTVGLEMNDEGHSKK